MRHKETVREFCRRRAVALMNSGWTTPLVAEVFAVTPATVYLWRKVVRSENGFALKSPSGRPCKPTDQQIEAVMSRNYFPLRMTNANAVSVVRQKFELLRPIMDERMRRRWAASEAISLGWGGIGVVAEAIGMTRKTICVGVAELKDTHYREGETPHMPVRRMNGPRHSGRPLKLTDEQLGKLEKLLKKGPLAHGWPNELWTAKRVAVVIRKHFQTTLTRQTTYDVLKNRMGWSLQVPSRQTRGRDDQEIQRWLKEEYPHILERARRRHASLVFIDESGFMLAPLLRRTYAPRGKQPVARAPIRMGESRLLKHYHSARASRLWIPFLPCRRQCEFLWGLNRAVH